MLGTARIVPGAPGYDATLPGGGITVKMSFSSMMIAMSILAC